MTYANTKAIGEIKTADLWQVMRQAITSGVKCLDDNRRIMAKAAGHEKK